MDAKKEGKLNRTIIKISSILLLLVGIGVLVVEYIYWSNQWVSNATALIVFFTSIVLYAVVGLLIMKNKNKIMNFGDDE